MLHKGAKNKTMLKKKDTNVHHLRINKERRITKQFIAQS